MSQPSYRGVAFENSAPIGRWRSILLSRPKLLAMLSTAKAFSACLSIYAAIMNNTSTAAIRVKNSSRYNIVNNCDLWAFVTPNLYSFPSLFLAFGIRTKPFKFKRPWLFRMVYGNGIVYSVHRIAVETWRCTNTIRSQNSWTLDAYSATKCPTDPTEFEDTGSKNKNYRWEKHSLSILISPPLNLILWKIVFLLGDKLREMNVFS